MSAAEVQRRYPSADTKSRVGRIQTVPCTRTPPLGSVAQLESPPRTAAGETGETARPRRQEAPEMCRAGAGRTLTTTPNTQRKQPTEIGAPVARPRARPGRRSWSRLGRCSGGVGVARPHAPGLTDRPLNTSRERTHARRAPRVRDLPVVVWPRPWPPRAPRPRLHARTPSWAAAHPAAVL
jgi:hypothetical protein